MVFQFFWHAHSRHSNLLSSSQTDSSRAVFLGGRKWASKSSIFNLICHFTPGGVDSHAGGLSRLGVLHLIEWFKLIPLSCMYVYVEMLSTWPGVQGHEPPPPEQEASPQGQLLALKGPTHPWLNAPGLLCPRGCWFYGPIHSIAPQMEGG